MGSNVFGTPVTDETLRGMPEFQYKETISRVDRATVAMQVKNGDGRDTNARKFVENLQSRFREDNVSTMCLIYNATGDTITFAEALDWQGRVCESPYPTIIGNGQWGAFLHGQRFEQDPSSSAGIVYSGFNSQGEERHWFFGFHNASYGDTNMVYAEIREAGHYHSENSEAWSAAEVLLGRGKLVSRAKEEGGLLFASIGNLAYPVFEAILTLPEAIKM